MKINDVITVGGRQGTIVNLEDGGRVTIEFEDGSVAIHRDTDVKVRAASASVTSKKGGK